MQTPARLCRWSAPRSLAAKPKRHSTLERRRAFGAETTNTRALPGSPNGPAKVLDFLRWKRRIEQTNPQTAQSTPAQRALMTTSEKLLRIVDLICRDETDDRLLDKVLRAVEQ